MGLTLEEKRNAIKRYCESCKLCLDCPIWESQIPDCFSNNDTVTAHYDLLVKEGKIIDPEATTKEDNEEDLINHPSHYTHGGMECIDEMKLIFGVEAVKHFCLLNAWKYRKRCLFKSGEEDIRKSDWYIAKYKELCGSGTEQTQDI